MAFQADNLSARDSMSATRRSGDGPSNEGWIQKIKRHFVGHPNPAGFQNSIPSDTSRFSPSLYPSSGRVQTNVGTGVGDYSSKEKYQSQASQPHYGGYNSRGSTTGGSYPGGSMVPLNQNPIKLDKQQGKLRRNKNHKPEDVDDKSVPTATENSNQKDLPTSSMQPCSKSAIGPESKTLPDIDQVEESDEELSSMNDDNSIQSRVEDMDLEQVFQDFQSIFSRAHDLCREHTPQSIPSLEWWNHHPNKASELSTVLSSNSKPPLKFEELRAYTIDQLGRAYVCGKIVCYLFPNSEPDRYLLSTGGRIEPKDFWTDRQTAEYLGCLEAKIYRLNAGRPHTLAKAERWRSQTVTLLSPIVADNEADLSPDGKLFAEELFKLYVQFIGIHSTADNGAVLEDFERMISQAIKVSRQLRQHHWKFIVRYPQNFSCGHTFRNFRIMGDVNAVDHRILETVNEQIEPPMGPIQYNPDDARTWIIDRPLLLQLRPNIKGKDGTMLRPPLVHVKARLLAAKG